MYICVPWCVCATHYTIIQTRYIDVCALLDMYELCACIWVTKQVTWYISHELCEWRAMCVYTSRGHCDFKCESPSKWATNMSYLIRNPNYVRICESRTMWLYIWVTNYTKWVSDEYVLPQTKHELCAYMWVTDYVTLYMSHELHQVSERRICLTSNETRTMCVYVSHGLCDFIYESRTMWERDKFTCDTY